MEKQMTTSQLFLFSVRLLLALLLLINSLPIVVSQEVENEREFDYIEGSETGPEKWGDIHPEWEMCKKGKLQSPIDLMNERVVVGTHLRKLERSYKPANATIKNRGHDIMLKWEGGAGTIQINDTQYVLQQCHWHSPSEHTINGKRLDLELHLVHDTPDKKIAVFGIIYKIGRPDTFLSELMEHIESIPYSGEDEKEEEAERSVGVMDPRHIKIGSRKYFRYIGSLTVPPCTENVVWTIVHKVGTASREQIRLLRDVVKDGSTRNARPAQAINKRPVHLYKPQERDEQEN